VNPRIKELAIEARLITVDGITRYALDNEFEQRFAELIVGECIAQCEKNVDHEWLGSGSKLSAFNIKEHFGVE
jgi:hypothetical protein